MVQESIVEYINSQMKLGVSRDAIKTTLTGAGWQAADVEDTLKKVEMAKTAAAQPTIVAKPAMSAMGSPASSAPQTIKVSDLVSSSASPAPMTMASKPVASSPASASTATSSSASRSPLTGPAAAASAATATKSSNTFQAQTFSAAKRHGSRGALITEIVLAVIIVAVGAFAGFLYMQNGSLTKQLSALSGTSSGVNSQLSALQAQVAASTTALTAQVATFTAETQELQTELSFYAVPSGATPGASITTSFSGIVSGGGKASYVITAMYGGKIYVANSKAASVIAALNPLIAKASASSTTSTAATSTTSTSATSSAPAASAQFAGTYVPGSDSITLTSVNGTAL